MGRADLRINVRDVEDVLERDVRLSAEECDLQPSTATIKVRLRVQKCRGEILVEGQVQSTYKTECALCLGPAAVIIDEGFQEAIKNFPEMEIDALEDVRNCFVSGIPIQILCRDTCKGLCPVCGRDRNREDCGCQGIATGKATLKDILDEALERGK